MKYGRGKRIKRRIGGKTGEGKGMRKEEEGENKEGKGRRNGKEGGQGQDRDRGRRKGHIMPHVNLVENSSKGKLHMIQEFFKIEKSRN